jgi:hypothetical protein
VFMSRTMKPSVEGLTPDRRPQKTHLHIVMIDEVSGLLNNRFFGGMTHMWMVADRRLGLGRTIRRLC